jgi:hypothetical protein
VLFSSLLSCQLFESTCTDEDRSCLGGGLLRSGKVCVRDGDCATGLHCVDNLCEFDGSTRAGGECLATAECGAGYYCSPIDLVCRAISSDPQSVGGTCSTSQECDKGLVCDADVDQLFNDGPFGLLSTICQDAVDRNDTPESCALPRTCTQRGKVDRGNRCESSRDCLAGLYCIPDIIDLRESVCFGGERLPIEPISVPLWGGVRCPADVPESVAYFEVPRASDDDSQDFYRLPFPNDIRRTDDGIDLTGHPSPPDDLTPATAARYLTESKTLDGFALNPVVYFRFSKAVRSADLSLDTLRIVDITPGSPEYGQKASIAWGPTKRRSNYICANWIGVHRPVGSPLRAGTTYAALITTGVRNDDGAAFARSDDFDAMLSDSRPSDSTLASAWERYAPLRAYLQGESDIEDAELLNAAVFTTQSETDVVPQLRAAIEADAVPELKDLTVCKSGVRSPCEDDLGRGKCHNENDAFTEIHGRVRLPIFQRGTAPYDTPEKGGDIARTELGAEIQSHADVCLAISVPKVDAPEAGFPVLLVAHPTGGSFSDQLGSSGLASFAATLETPSVVLSFDLPVHGDRRGDSTRPPQDLFFNLVNPKSARGNALQGAADLMAVARLIDQGVSAADSPLDGAIPFDPRRVALFAHSQGATHAALMIGSEPRIRSVVLAGLSGLITTQLLNLKRPTDTSSVLPFLLFDPDTKGKLVGGDANPMLALMQGYLDSSDPINYAHQLQFEPPESARDGHDVFFVYGLFDSFAPELSQKAFADAAGLAAVDPDLTLAFNEIPSPTRGNVMPGQVARTVGLRTYDPKGDAINPELVQDGHLVATMTRRGLADVRRFLGQALNGETPQIGQ